MPGTATQTHPGRWPGRRRHRNALSPHQAPRCRPGQRPARGIHEVGTTRMGSDPKKSVVNEFEQLHDADNVFIVDAGPFVSQADKNPTWTIMALSWRTSEFIIQELKKQNI